MAELKSRAQLADEWGVSLSTVKRITGRADFPTPVRLGASVRWVGAEVDAWVESQRSARVTRYHSRYRELPDTPPILLIPADGHGA